MVAKRRRATSVNSSQVNPYAKGFLNSKGSLNESGTRHRSVLVFKTAIAVDAVVYLNSRCIIYLMVRPAKFGQLYREAIKVPEKQYILVRPGQIFLKITRTYPHIAKEQVEVLQAHGVSSAAFLRKHRD